MAHFVLIKEYDTDKIVECIECKSERSADGVEDGININLNHEEYYTEVVET